MYENLHCIIRLMNKRALPFAIFLFASVLFFSCAGTNYIIADYEDNKQKLVLCQAYTDGLYGIETSYLVDEERAAEIRGYYKENAGLDLDELAASSVSTWGKAVELAVFVEKNIPHDNQKEGLSKKNAISLWEYSRRVPTGFNCRWHSILLSELMLSAGIKNYFVTCRPEDKDDGDCHVVNLVWLPELEKWAMIDCDMMEYVTGDDGLPLSLEEMREYVVEGKELNINVLPGFEDSWVAKESGIKYMKAYWTKNLYWFEAHSTMGFDLEGEMLLPDSYIALVPPSYLSTAETLSSADIMTTNAGDFWRRIMLE